MAAGNAEAQAGQLRALIALGETGEAEVIDAGLPEDLIRTPPMARVRSALDLAREARPVGNLGELQERGAADPADPQARFALAGGMMAEGDDDGTAEARRELIRRDREWNDGDAVPVLRKLVTHIG